MTNIRVENRKPRNTSQNILLVEKPRIIFSKCSTTKLQWSTENLERIIWDVLMGKIFRVVRGLRFSKNSVALRLVTIKRKRKLNETKCKRWAKEMLHDSSFEFDVRRFILNVFVIAFRVLLYEIPDQEKFCVIPNSSYYCIFTTRNKRIIYTSITALYKFQQYFFTA